MSESLLRGADPVWIAALDAYPDARAEAERLVANGQVPATGSLFDRLLWVLWIATECTEGPCTGVLAFFAQHLREILLDRTAYVATELAAVIAAAVHRQFPEPFPGWDTAAGCAPWRDPSTLYLVVLWPTDIGHAGNGDGGAYGAVVSVYRVQRCDKGLCISDAPTVADAFVWGDDTEVNFPRGPRGEYETAADARAAAEAGLAGVEGGFEWLARMIVVHALRGTDWVTHMHGDHEEPDDRQGEPWALGESENAPGATPLADAMVSLVGVAPRLAGEVLARASSDFGRRSLVGARAALVDECGLALALHLSAAQTVAYDLAPLVRGASTENMRSAPSLMSTAAAAIGRWRASPTGSALADAPRVADLPDAARDAAAFATWQSVCSAPLDPSTGQLHGANRLVDVARALGVDPTSAQIAHPERLCPDLLDAAVRAGVRGNYPGVTPMTPGSVMTRDPDARALALELVGQTWERWPNLAAPFETDEVSAWEAACRVDPEARLAPAHVRMLLDAVIEEEGAWAPDEEAAVMDEAERAAAADLPLAVQPERRRGGDRADRAHLLPALAPFVDLARMFVAINEPIDPRDLVYPGRMCARLALYRALG
ncbi:hypothetical protein pdul_cds_614 [Pandoravirus dulcis]|uniref:Uncharacterized protein n=1 Tax=Pandoravirus dulcis TaxID=1349409 RepID=S4VTJ0_9VIRU|nr:hypothetical protein pdul_cds_614 [Pandoravirus dulcis]AGO82740.1 hypothetical protein pdul_cds_614 [Pandoravirus dulcis]